MVDWRDLLYRYPVRMRRLAALVLGLVAVLVYVPTLPHPFVLDDFPAVVNNPAAQWPLDLEAIATSNYWGNPPHYESLTIYRPLATLTFALTDGLGGRDAPGCHRLINLVLHAACTVLLFVLLLRLLNHEVLGPLRVTPSRGFGYAAGVALLFAVHPVHSEAVIGVVSRAELLAAFFVLLGLTIEAGPRSRWRLPALLGTFALALLSKENGATLWAALMAFHAVQLLHGWLQDRRASWKILWPHVGLAAVLAGYLALRWAVLPGILAGDLSGADNPMVGAGPVGRWLTPFVVLLEYVRLTVAPAVLTIDYSLNHLPAVTSLAHAGAWFGLVLFVGLVVAAAVALRRQPLFAMLVGAFFGTYIVVANLLFLSTIIMAERLLYLPSAFLLAALGFPALLSQGGLVRSRSGVVLAAGCLLVAGLFGVRTVVRGADWRSPRALYEAAVHAAPESAKSRHLLANALAADGELRAAVEHYEEGARIDPTNFVLRTNAARTLARLGRYDRALAHLEAALTTAPEYAPAFHLVCGIFERSGKPPAAGRFCFPEESDKILDSGGGRR